MKVYFYFFIIIAQSINCSEYKERNYLDIAQIQTKTTDDWINLLNRAAIFSDTLTFKVTSSCPLFKKYPALKHNLPYISFGALPTPLHKLNNLNQILNTNLYIKRDDFTGFFENGTYNYGGNKVRKLEFLLAQALAQGSNAVITFGCAGSNHALATSIYAKRLGLKCICMLKPQPNATGVKKNLLMHILFDTELHYYPDDISRKVGTFSSWWNHKQNSGRAPYIIPTGGSSPLGAIGFVNAAFELKEQIDKGELEEPDRIFVACGSVATTAGLLLGCKLIGLKSKVHAIAIEPESEPNEFRTTIKKLFDETSMLLHKLDSSIPLKKLQENDYELNLNFCGSAYGIFTDECKNAYKLLRENENISLDGTYTAKAFAGLIDYINNHKKNETILFWNTYCGFDFSDKLKNIDYHSLPHCFHIYFESKAQELGVLGSLYLKSKY